MNWQVVIKPKVLKELKNKRKIPEDVEISFEILVIDLKSLGPAIKWPNYGKLLNQGKGLDRRHCHIQKGKSTWVVCWEVDKKNKLIEVYYVGTHEKAPY